MSEKMRSFIRDIPKAELHLHIEGTLEPELKFTLAKRNGIELPYADAQAMREAYDFNDLPSFLAIYYEGMGVLITEEDFYDLTMAYLRKAHEQQVVYAEIFFDPQGHTSRGVPFETVITGIHRAQEDAQKELGITTQLIMCFLRDMSADSAMETLQQSLPYRSWIIGVGLDSDEKGNPPMKFAEVFSKAREEGYRLTMHCDVDQEDSIDHIRDCLHEIGVERIDHGVNSLEDERIVEELIERQIGLTVCPVSNRYVVASLRSKEIRQMLEKGMLVTVNSDDPAYFDGYMIENIAAVQEAEDLSSKEIATLMNNAFQTAWLTDEKKQQYIDGVNAFLARQD